MFALLTHALKAKEKEEAVCQIEDLMSVTLGRASDESQSLFPWIVTISRKHEGHPLVRTYTYMYNAYNYKILNELTKCVFW